MTENKICKGRPTGGKKCRAKDDGSKVSSKENKSMTSKNDTQESFIRRGEVKSCTE